jgi:hypothetical protein
MKEVLIGLVAMGVGGLLCFGGYFSGKLMLAKWSAFVGFLTGAAVVAAATGDGFLQTSMGWLMGLVFAIVLVLMAFSFYELGVVGLLGSAAFLLSAGVMSAFGMDWSWTVGLIAAVVGAIVALSTFTMDLPRGLLVVVNSFAGGLVFVQGLMLLVGVTGLTSFESGSAVAMPNSAWAWLVAWLVVSLSGFYVQWMSGDEPVGSRSSWK